MQISKYSMFELTLNGPSVGNPFTEVDLRAQFSHGGESRVVSGFYDGGGVYKIRFMPQIEGEWTYKTNCNAAELDGKTGAFECVAARQGDHGAVRVSEQFHFAHDDGTPFFPVGTTAYNWTNQASEIVAQTIETLGDAPFNKVRYGPFPKHYLYNFNEPQLYPYEGGVKDKNVGYVPASNPGMAMFSSVSDAYSFDFTRFNPEFWRQFENHVITLQKMGIETDLILFHPYDRWGFAQMSHEENLLYIRYIVARLGAIPSVWWSMANEYDLFSDRTVEQWEAYAAAVVEWDAADHLRSIHNCGAVYDHSKPWITHVSYQRINYHSHVELTAKFREQWQKPFVMDEICYEGNIDSGFGNIPGEEMVKRFWDVAVRGGYCTHGETYLRDDDVLWWAKGGCLTGTSPERIAFMRRILEKIGYISPSPSSEWDLPWGLSGETYKAETGIPYMPYSYSADKMLCYFSFSQPAKRTFRLPPDKQYEIEIIDTWNMTVEKLAGTYSDSAEIPLPGRQYIAVLFTRVG